MILRQLARSLRNAVPGRSLPRARAAPAVGRGMGSTPPARRTPVSVPTGSAPSNPPNFQPEITYEPLDRGLPYRRALLLFSVPVGPWHWPAYAELMSPLFGVVQFALKAQKIGMNVVYDGTGTAKDLNGVEGMPARLVYPDGRVYAWDRFTEATLDTEEFRDAAGYTAQQPEGGLGPVSGVMVCTHGARDCRCVERGAPLVRALRDALSSSSSPSADSPGTDLQVTEIAHVGGHKWAANALLYPSLDMFSNLAASDAPALVRFLRSRGQEETHMWAHWRGRIGYNDLVQMQLGARVDRILASVPSAGPGEAKGEGEGESGSLDSAAGSPQSAGSAATTRTKADASRTAPDPLSDPLALDTPDLAGLDAAAARQKWAGKPTVPLTFTTHDGRPISVDAPLGATLLEVGKLFDLPGLEGTCGGNCECATCHLYLDRNGEGWESAPVPEPSEEEDDMLFTALAFRDGASRLGCQIPVTRELAAWNGQGGRLNLPQY